MMLRLPALIAALCAASTLCAQSPEIVDRSFRATLNVQPEAVLPLEDGRLYVAGTELRFSVGGRTQSVIARLNRDGSVDPSFNIGAGFNLVAATDALYNRYRGDDNRQLTLAFSGPLRVFLVPLSQGRVAIFCTLFFQVEPRLPPVSFDVALAAFNPDGTSATTFDPDTALRFPLTFAPDRVLHFPSGSVTPLADGRIVKLALDRDSSGSFLALTRFLADGGLDATFSTTRLRIPAVPNPDRVDNVVLTTRDPAGRIYVCVTHPFHDPVAATQTSIFPANGVHPEDRSVPSQLFRLQPDGTPDTVFAPAPLAEILSIRATEAGLLCQQTQWAYGPGIVGPPLGFVTALVNGGPLTNFRLTFDGTADPTYRSTVTTTWGAAYGQLSADSNGNAVMLAHGQFGHRGLVRFDRTGASDPDTACELGDDAARSSTISPLPDGQWLVRGNFTTLGGVATSYLARVTPSPRAGATYLANLSALGRVSGGGEPLIAGCISTGGPTTVLVRAAGPGLAQFGVPGTLADPRLRYFDDATLVAENDDWSSPSGSPIAVTGSALNAFPFPTGSKDAALIATSAAGAHTVHVTSGDATVGITLLELYAAGPDPTSIRSPRLSNLSARMFAGVGAETATVGFIVKGDNSRNILLRAVGAGLAKFGVTGGLVDPALVLYRGSTPIARNDNWQDGSLDDQFLRVQASNAVFAFPLDNGGKDSALVVTLAPGPYTAQVTGANGATGTVLVEVYEIP